MKIYAVDPDLDFRLIYPEDKVYQSENWAFNCQSLAGKLPLHFSAYLSDKSDKPLPDIAWIGMLTFAFRADVAEELLDILESSGELLPFTLNDEQWYVYNVLSNSTDAVDVENSQYEIDDGETRFGLKKPKFIEKNLPRTSLFKIKEDNFSNIYCIDKRESDSDVLDNFYCAVAAKGYTGVKFTEID